jgi:hypothetical protein
MRIGLRTQRAFLPADFGPRSGIDRRGPTATTLAIGRILSETAKGKNIMNENATAPNPNTAEPNDLEILNGGIEITVVKIDGSQEQVKVRQLPMSLVSEWGSMQGDEAGLIDLLCGQRDRSFQWRLRNAQALELRLLDMLQRAEFSQLDNIEKRLADRARGSGAPGGEGALERRAYRGIDHRDPPAGRAIEFKTVWPVGHPHQGVDRPSDEGSDLGPEDEPRDGITLGQLVAAVCVILQLKDPAYLLDNFSPALCKLIYRTRQREMLRAKQVDLRIAAAAATNSGMVTNAGEILSETGETLRELINTSGARENDNPPMTYD